MLEALKDIGHYDVLFFFPTDQEDTLKIESCLYKDPGESVGGSELGSEYTVMLFQCDEEGGTYNHDTFDAILRSVPDKLLGVVLMFSSILLLFVLPWLDTSPVRSARFRPIYRWLIWVLVLCVVILGFCGARPPEGIWVILSRICTLYYFAHFLVILPILGKLERPLSLPESISQAVTGGRGGGAFLSNVHVKPMEKA